MVWGFDAEGFPLSVGRLSGIDTMMGCDKLEVDSALEILLPDQDIESEPPLPAADARRGCRSSRRSVRGHGERSGPGS